jgi:hypothetical protein
VSSRVVEFIKMERILTTSLQLQTTPTLQSRDGILLYCSLLFVAQTSTPERPISGNQCMRQSRHPLQYWLSDHRRFAYMDLSVCEAVPTRARHPDPGLPQHMQVIHHCSLYSEPNCVHGTYPGPACTYSTYLSLIRLSPCLPV